MSIEGVRRVADAVLYEGYLLYPYRATSGKNQVRWQFGVLGPEGAEQAGTGEGSHLAMQCLLRADPESELVVHLRFLQVQQRVTEAPDPGAEGGFVAVPELAVDDQRWYSWDEAVEVEREHPVRFAELAAGCSWNVVAEAGAEIEELVDRRGAIAGRLVRRRYPVRAVVHAELEPVDGLHRLTLTVDNLAAAPGLSKDEALRQSLVGTHLILEARTPQTQFVSVIDPPEDAVAAARGCRQQRCWPVLAGPAGRTDLVLGSPIILYDYPEIAPESPGALFDACEIDEILTLRVMTMTEEEKAQARATDPRARDIIERCDQMTPADLQQLHGILRDPHGGDAGGEVPGFDTGEVPWWDPATDERVQPELDAVLIDGVLVSKGSLVRVHPSRRADAQDLFFVDQVARVTAVISDVDGQTHVALVLVDDPAAELHDWYGRYLYFAPEELEPLHEQLPTPLREES